MSIVDGTPRDIPKLLALAGGAALLLTLLYLASAGRIESGRLEAERAALQAVLPPMTHDNDLLRDSFIIDPGSTAFARIELLGLSTARTAYRARLQGRPSGVILPLETMGYNGPITLLVGMDMEGVITGARVMEHAETPGLGDRMELDESRWILGFDNRSLGNTDDVLWRVKKDGGDFDQFTGATITPRAVVAAVHDALLFFEANRELLLNQEMETP